MNCPNGFSAHKSYCYVVSDEDTYTWSEAKAYCRSLAALSTLACPSEKSVTDFVKSDVDSFAWTGINDISEEDDWWCLGSYEQSYFREYKRFPKTSNKPKVQRQEFYYNLLLFI